MDQLDQMQRQAWRQAAEGWERWQGRMREVTAPLASWMVDAIEPQPGQRVLELAAGIGETGFLAAQRVGPEGSVISSDQSPEMSAAGRRRAEELGLGNVEFTVIDAQRNELETDSVDAVLCRFGFMLMGDADQALRETHRVLRPGGRLALAVWAPPDQNQWMAAPVMQLVARGAFELPPPDAPGPFAMAGRGRLGQRLEAVGFSQVRIEPIQLTHRYAGFDDYWNMNHDLAAPIAAALAGLDDTAVEAVREGTNAALKPYEREDGSLEIPALAIGAAAVA